MATHISTAKNSSAKVKSTSAPQTATLLGISPELRNRIYEYALITPGEVQLIDIILRFEDQEVEPALLRTCKQTRQEAFTLYWDNLHIVASGVKIYQTAVLTKPQTTLGHMLHLLGRKRCSRIQNLALEPSQLSSANLRGTAFWFSGGLNHILGPSEIDEELLHMMIEPNPAPRYLAGKTLRDIHNAGVRLEAVILPELERSDRMTRQEVFQMMALSDWKRELEYLQAYSRLQRRGRVGNRRQKSRAKKEGPTGLAKARVSKTS